MTLNSASHFNRPNECKKCFLREGRALEKDERKLQLNDDKIAFNNPICHSEAFDVVRIRRHFPVLSAKLHNACGHDSAAGTWLVFEKSAHGPEIKLQTIYGPDFVIRIGVEAIARQHRCRKTLRASRYRCLFLCDDFAQNIFYGKISF